MRWIKYLLSAAVLFSFACDIGEVPVLGLTNPLDSETASETGLSTPALVFFPDSVSVSLGLSVPTKVYAMEVENLGVAHVQFSYNNDLLSVTSITAGDFFQGSQDPIFLVDDDAEAGTIDIYTSFLGTETTSVSGTGSLAIITFSTKAVGKTTLIYSTDSVLLDPNSNLIEIKGYGEGLIDAQ